MTASRIGLLHGGALGDFVLTWHLLRTFGREHADSELCVWARAPVADTDPGIWGVDRLIDVESCGLHSLFVEDAHCSCELAETLRACDLLINTLANDDSALAVTLRRCLKGDVVSLETAPKSGHTDHVTHQWAAILKRQGHDLPAPGEFELRVDASRVRSARDRIRATAGTDVERVVLIHPGSGSRRKCWALANFFFLANELISCRIGVVFIVGPVERELFTAEELESIRARPYIELPSLEELIDLVAAADLCVGNDSGFCHLAAAVPGSRVLALFGATDPRVWRPLGRCVQVAGSVGEWPDTNTVLERARVALESN